MLRPITIQPGAVEPSGLTAFIEATKPLLPIPALAVLMPLLFWFFRSTWRELDAEALRERARLARGEVDRRPFVAFVLCAVILTMQEYYGGRGYFDQAILPKLTAWNKASPDVVKLDRYLELYGFAWWAGTRVLGYVLVPLPLWKLLFRKDSLLDLGLRTKGFIEHAWIYGLFLAVVLPAMFVVARSPDFGGYYPFYKQSTRSWSDLLMWEAMYFAQFFALEVFFRGFWLGALRRTLGSSAIFAMAVPYCMIHYGKPYLEAVGAIVAGIALGSLSMKTKSIYQGFLVHITVALLMDWLALRHRNATPVTFWPAPLDTRTTTLAEHEALREQIAHRVELGFALVALVAFALVAWLFVRQRRRSLAHALASGSADIEELGAPSMRGGVSRPAISEPTVVPAARISSGDLPPPSSQDS